MVPMSEEIKEWIDTATYEQLLWQWRFADLGNDLFSKEHESSDYFVKIMKEKRFSDGAHATASKAVGW
jgi:hypothetical protein